MGYRCQNLRVEGASQVLSRGSHGEASLPSVESVSNAIRSRPARQDACRQVIPR
jgi:hypothetical protein